ncbi:vacuolar iron transporter-like protein [Trifolium medium]|uniref:Vacuolar iron transporter-like protein n=1 Tax=Trifolium medium TaxID=97028 RepID=A0A392Q9H4_9FABA|nr:vacuolar iron transporter-like protein [Trifolium medium]
MNYSNGTVSEYKSVNSVTTTSSETFVSSRDTTKGAIQNHYQEKPELLVPISVTVGSLIVESSPNDVNKPLEFFKNSTNDVNKTLEFIKNNDSSLRQDGAQSPFDSTSSAIDATFPSKMDSTLIEKTRKEINEKINNYVGKENNSMCMK